MTRVTVDGELVVTSIGFSCQPGDALLIVNGVCLGVWQASGQRPGTQASDQQPGTPTAASALMISTRRGRPRGARTARPPGDREASEARLLALLSHTPMTARAIVRRLRVSGNRRRWLTHDIARMLRHGRLQADRTQSQRFPTYRVAEPQASGQRPGTHVLSPDTAQEAAAP